MRATEPALPDTTFETIRSSHYDDNQPTSQHNQNTGDDDSSDDEYTSNNSDQPQDDAGGESDAASDSTDSSLGRDHGHEGTTRPPPDPDQTIWVDEAHCPECLGTH